MKIVLFGLTVSSSWGNGHATLLRGLLRSLGTMGHRCVFFEKDLPFYAAHRDLPEGDGFALRLYRDWKEVREAAAREVADADVAIVTSYAPDSHAASRLILEREGPVRVFYDLDSPVTLLALRNGRRPAYIPDTGFAGFDLVLSYAGGRALGEIRDRLGGARVAPLYGSVDPRVHRCAPPEPRFAADLSYLGTWAADRQQGVDELFLRPARLAPAHRFVLGGAQYPDGIGWTDNVWLIPHVPPPEHATFFSSSRMTLNVTRTAMVEYGHCPSGRLFEASACRTPVLTDHWDGLESFYRPGEEVLVVNSAEDVIAALELSDAERHRLAAAAYERTMQHHTAAARARELVMLVEEAATPRAAVTATEAA